MSPLPMAQPVTRRSPRLRDWGSGLPLELLESISRRLPSGREAAAFRSVCSRWHAALPFARFAPMLMLPFDPESPEGVVTFYRVTDGKVISKILPEMRGKALCGSSRGWVALMDDSGSVTLLNPFTGAGVELPPVDERLAAASLMRVSLVDGRWVLRRPNGSYTVPPVRMRDVFFREIVLSSTPSSDCVDDCVVMAVLASSEMVAFCRVGDVAWTLLDTNRTDCCVNSIVYCQGKFVTIGCTDEISICNVTAGEPPTATRMPSLVPPKQPCRRSYLQMNGKLHRVCTVRKLDKTQRFTYCIAVYKCNLLAGKPAWSRVKVTGDLALFVSKHFTANFGGASVSAFKRNSVYFSEPLYHGHQQGPNHRVEIASIANGTSELQAYHQKMKGSEPLRWIKPNLWIEGGQTNARVVKDRKKKRLPA